MGSFQVLHTPDETLNRIQANIAKTFGASSGQSITLVNAQTWSINTSDKIVQFDTSAIPGVTASVALKITLPDATTCNGFAFSFKKSDSSANPFQFITTGKNKQGNQQTIEGAASPYQSVVALASGALYSDGSNWWVL